MAEACFAPGAARPSARIPHRLLCAALVGFALASCGQKTSTSEQSVQPIVSSEELAAAASRRVIFAHQSVGNNILDAMRTFASARNVALHIVETRSPPPSGAGLFHFAVGANGSPEGKIDDFTRTLAHTLAPTLAPTPSGGTADASIALLELCFIDFGPETDGRKLAASYASALERLQAQFPQTRFVAMTAPLMTVQTGPRAWIKRMLGREPARYAQNGNLNDFNTAIRQRFAQPGALFDLARLESTGNGAPTQFERNGHLIPALDPALTDDGGHLNDRGKAVVGSAWVKFLAGAPQ